ncbi:MAG: PBP1A family penicillin-binding protein [Desulfobacteraceae bacterium]|nr:MAG: PBP1A family penicillin-binding protein [Desulfobacteraceae bacterium]
MKHFVISDKNNRLFSFRKICIIIFAAFISGIIAGTFIALTRDLPQIRSLESFRPAGVTRIYSADGILLSELYLEKREPVQLKTIPYYLKAALVATEDRTFYRHSGVDIKGILRAIIKDIIAGEYAEGASTITQQVAKTFFLTPKKSLLRKIKEAILSFQLERRYTKDEIMELYVNQIYFGSGAYGVESASKLYFGKSAKYLSLTECAMIAGLPKSPSRFSPLINLNAAQKRRNIVLKQMLATGIISETEYNTSAGNPVILFNHEQSRVIAPYFTEYVKNYLEEVIGASRLYRGGLTVHTTLLSNLQDAAEESSANGIAAIAKRMKKRGMSNPDPQCALIAIDIKTGGIVAMTGGNDFYKSPFNRATMALRQPGSAFKPFIYALAVERGFTQHSLLLDAPVAFKGGKSGKDWIPHNYSGGYEGEITLRRALAISENIPAIRLAEILGPSSVAQFAHKLGIVTPLAPDLSLALGTSGMTLVELSSAYAVFPNMGKYIKPFCVTEVEDHRGNIIWRTKPQKRIAMSEEGAAIMTNMLEAVINEGTGAAARVLNRSVAGKTGTTNDHKDALFIGFSPSVLAGVWVGRDIPASLGKGETGAKTALPVWIDFMSKALSSKQDEVFKVPDGVVLVKIDPATSHPAASESQVVTTALYRKGTEPE